MRQEFPVSVRKAALARCAGHCEDCGRELTGGPKDSPQYDHDIPDGLGGKPTLDNCVVRCPPCHLVKTTTRDVPAIAKAKRIEAKRLGLRAAKAVIPGGRGSKFKRLISGKVVLRDG